MRPACVVAIALASAAFGAAVSGWILRTAPDTRLSAAVLSNTGYQGPASVPLGDMAGGAAAHGAIDMPNPRGDSDAVVAEGKQLFRQMNCAGCHGYDGGGGMGPPLNDEYWRYGGKPAQVYKTLFEGRPQGMPAWGVALPPDKLWALTAYVESLGGGIEPKAGVAARDGDERKGSTAKGGSPILEGQ
ncbi:c-type cytochrome [Novosphingobium sp. Gsoil 351]|uniref:c-type cytochrome n=1 Tax=Novosphingobium sp. Gsoil 351 TaxID=2675225 RepID=UPI0012B4C794|nr:c-type cytochrome [Novosphingobium sp. Gsoil 351]QGN54126.1 c-type cytochrome [Novosphingobium sp. Gsoil 351]